MMKKILALYVIICLILTACSKDSTQSAREAWLSKDDSDIVFGMSYPITTTEENTGFLDGINMAVEEVNREGILGKKISIWKVDDEGSVTTGSKVAQSFINNPHISAVIGHWNSRVSNTVAGIYNRNGMVMITPASTSPLLTEKEYEYVFSIINDDIDYGSTMARYASKTGLDKVAVFYAEDDYGRGLANAFEDAAYENKIEVIDRTTSINARNIQDFVDKWEAYDYNAIFIADVMSSAMGVIETLRSAGVQVPIMGATGIDRISFIENMGSYAEGITMPSAFNPSVQRIEMETFVKDYEKKYGYAPDSWAAQGYEVVMILCHAIESGGSATPDKIAKALSQTKDYKGITGDLNCNAKGEIIGADIYVKAVENSKYVYKGKY